MGHLHWADGCVLIGEVFSFQDHFLQGLFQKASQGGVNRTYEKSWGEGGYTKTHLAVYEEGLFNLRGANAPSPLPPKETLFSKLKSQHIKPCHYSVQIKGVPLNYPTLNSPYNVVGYNLFDSLCSTVEVNDSLVYPHLIAVPGLGPLPTGGLTTRDTEGFGGHANGTFDTELGLLGPVDEVAAYWVRGREGERVGRREGGGGREREEG